MNLTTKIATILILTIIFSSCNSNTKSKKTENTPVVLQKNETIKKDHHEKKHWSYEGETSPEHWAEFEKNSECNGKYQSPINIITLDALIDTSLKPLDIHYKQNTKIHDIKNNGHSIQYNFEEGDFINYKEDIYNLKQIHFHESSEHTIDGIRYPLVIHMVHTNSKGEYLVVAVMAKEGKSSDPFDFLESYLPVKIGETKPINTAFNINLNLPKNKGYYTYSGSLTTPPCTQGVNWFIFKDPITISLEQVNKLKKLMPVNNYRNTQKINGRTIKMTR